MSSLSLGNSWTTIESDPGVFTALIQSMGCKDVQVEELLTLSPEALMADSMTGSKVFGLIFLFHFDEKMQKKIEERLTARRRAKRQRGDDDVQMRDGGEQGAVHDADVEEKQRAMGKEQQSDGMVVEGGDSEAVVQEPANLGDGDGDGGTEGAADGGERAATVDAGSPPSSAGCGDTDVFFAQQVVANACATQAVLGVLLNADEEGSGRLELGDTLKDLKTFTKDFPADLKGAAIGGCDPIRLAHNSFAKPDPFVHESSSSARGAGDDDLFHFIAYVPVNGKVYELDGLKEAPDCLGSIPLSAASSSGDPGGDDAEWLKLAFAHIEEKIRLHSEIGEEGGGGHGGGEIRFNLLAIVRDRRLVLRELLSSASSDARRSEINAELLLEEKRHEAWRLENERRRHNYIPFIFTLLKAMSEKGKLKSIIDEALHTKSKKRAKRS